MREIFELDADRLLLVASDRISTFDVVLPTEIPDKGRVLTGLSGFWFARTREIVPNHLLALRAGRPLDRGAAARDAADRVRRARLPRRLGLEGLPGDRRGLRPCASRRACASRTGCPSPSSRRRRRPRPGTTRTSTASRRPSSSARELLAEVERIALELYRFAAEHAAERGIILADTKFEFGLDADGTLVLGDEALTPDSSRFWPADEYEPGRPQPSFDKQYVRDYCETLGWDKTPPGPELPNEVVDGTRARYVEAFERLTGIAFDDYVADPEVVLR